MRNLLRLSAAAATLALSLSCARADVLRLQNGRTFHGTVDRGYVDPDTLRIHLFSTGGTVKVRWDHLIAEDREAWQVDLGLKESKEALELKIDAWKITIAGKEPFHALILNPEAIADGAPANGDVKMLSKGKEYTYPRGLIAAVPTRCDLALIFTPQQAYERKKAEIGPNNGQAHFDLAEYARLVGDLDHAKEEYLAAKEDTAWLETNDGRRLESRMTTLEVLLKNQNLLRQIDDVRNLLLLARSQQDFVRRAQSYRKALEEANRLLAVVKDPGLQKEFRLLDLATRAQKERRTFFQDKLPMEVWLRVRKLIGDKAREGRAKDIPVTASAADKARLQLQGTFEGARQYAGRQVSEDLWAAMVKDVGAAAELEKIQADLAPPVNNQVAPKVLTEEERKALEERAALLGAMEKKLPSDLAQYWKDRAKNNFNVSSYGYGTFIVAGTTLKLTRKTPAPQQGGNRNRGGGGGQQATQAVDVVKTADQWWDDPATTTKEKTDWLLSWCAERAQNLFEVTRQWDENCDSCGGLGYRKVSNASTGEEEAERCKLCNGAKVMRKIKWR